MSSLLQKYDTVLFTDIYPDLDSFRDDYFHVGIPTTLTVDSNVNIIYYLLYSKYGNSPIANWDKNQFKYKLFSIIWQFGPTWEKRLDIQAKLRALSDDDILKGAKAIYNHALNPETEPTTSTLDELSYINEQNTTNYKKSKMDAYTQLWNLLATDVTSDFINRFAILFKKFVADSHPIIYVNEVDD